MRIIFVFLILVWSLFGILLVSFFRHEASKASIFKAVIRYQPCWYGPSAKSKEDWVGYRAGQGVNDVNNPQVRHAYYETSVFGASDATLPLYW